MTPTGCPKSPFPGGSTEDRERVRRRDLKHAKEVTLQCPGFGEATAARNIGPVRSELRTDRAERGEGTET